MSITENVFFSATDTSTFSMSGTIDTNMYQYLTIKLCSSGGNCNIVTGLPAGGGAGAFIYCLVYTVIDGVPLSTVTYTLSNGTVTLNLNYGGNTIVFKSTPGQIRTKGGVGSVTPGSGSESWFSSNFTNNSTDASLLNNYIIFNGPDGAGFSSNGFNPRCGQSNGFTSSGSATNNDYDPYLYGGIPEGATGMKNKGQTTPYSQGGGGGSNGKAGTSPIVPASGYGGGAAFTNMGIPSNPNPGGDCYVIINLNQNGELSDSNLQLINAQKKEFYIGNLGLFNVSPPFSYNGDSFTILSNVLNVSIAKIKHGKFFANYRAPITINLNGEVLILGNLGLTGNISKCGKLSNLHVFGRKYEFEETKRAIKLINDFLSKNIDQINTLL